MIIHVVTSGESLYSIAQKNHISMAQILGDNQLLDPSHLVIGQTIVIRYPETSYTVHKEDTIYSIATSNGLTIRELWQNNPCLNGGTAIYIGQQLVLKYKDTSDDKIMTYGYASPSIDDTLLRGTLPYLTALAPITHGVVPTDVLHDLDDTDIKQECIRIGTDPIFHVSTFLMNEDAAAEFSHSLRTSDPWQERLIRQIVEKTIDGNYCGVDVDFDDMQGHDALAFIQFICRLKQSLAIYGLPLIVTLSPPKISHTNMMASDERQDYALLGEIADYILLMTHRRNHAYAPPTAIAPLSFIRHMLKYVLTQIPKEKILLGISTCGYDWTLPTPKGAKAMPIGSQQAVTLAWNHHSAICYSEDVQVPHFNYSDAIGREHEVWFEDARSMDAKLQLIKEYGLCGVGYLNVDSPFPQNWVVLSAMYQIQDGIS